MKRYLLIFLVLWGANLAAQSGELVGTFSVESSTGSDPSPTVTGYFNSTVGFLPGAVDTGDIFVARQVFSGNHRRKLYRITGISGNSPLTLTMTLVSGTTGGPFPSGTHGICRPSEKGYLLDIPNVSQEIESYIANYNTKKFEDADVDTTINRSDSMFVVLNDGTEFYVGPSTANGISDSYQTGDSIFVVTGMDTIFTGIAYANPEIDTIYNDGTNYYLVTVTGDTIEIGAVAQVVANGLHPTNPPTYLVHIDTLGVDTIYFDNAGVWTRFNVGGNQIGAPLFSSNNGNVIFDPAGVPPIGSFIIDQRGGRILKKQGVSTYQAKTEGNGRLVRNTERFIGTGTVTGWSLSNYSAANLFINSSDAVVNNPSDIDNPALTTIGSLKTVCINNGTGSPRWVKWGNRFRNQLGLPLDSMFVTENSVLTLDFSCDEHDSERIMRICNPPQTATPSVSVSDLANGLDIFKPSNTITIAPDITELTYAVPVLADSILFWDSSANTHNRTSVGDIVALASAGSTTVTDQANGLDIALTGSNITIAPDWNEVATSTAAAGDVLLVYDISIPGYRAMTASSIAATAAPAPDATKVTKGGDADGAALTIGTNDNFNLVFETNNIPRAKITTGGIFDFDQLGIDDVDFANLDSSYIINPRIAALAADYSTYTASATLTRRLAHYVDGSANVTMTVNSALPDRSVFFIKNQDAAFLVSVFVPSGMSLSGPNWIPPGYTAWFQRRGTVIERLDQVTTEVTGRQVMSTAIDGVFTTPHPFGAAGNVKYANVQIRNEIAPYIFTIKAWGPNQIIWQCWNPVTGLAQQLINIEFTWIIKG